jgi:hypothetical protein
MYYLTLNQRAAAMVEDAMQAICIELLRFGDKPGNGLPLQHPL